MFATLRVNPEKNSFDEVERPSAPGHSACVLCRAKKLKCTGEESGCNRCALKGFQCQYPAPSSKGSKTGTRAPAKSKESTPPKSCGQECRLPPEPAEPAGFDENLNFSYGTPFDTDINTFSMEHELSADFWGDFGTGSTSPNPVVLDLPVPPGENSEMSDYDFSISTTTSDIDMALLNSLDLPSVPPSKFAGAQVSQTILSPALEDREAGDVSKANSSCQCIAVATSLLESICIQNSCITQPSVSRTLRLYKYTLARYKRLLTCERCSGESSFLMLLIVASQNLVDGYETIVQLLVNQFNEIHKGSFYRELLHERDSHKSTSIPRSDDRPPVNVQGLQEYDFDHFEEPCVFEGIVNLQLKFLQSLLHRVRSPPYPVFLELGRSSGSVRSN